MNGLPSASRRAAPGALLVLAAACSGAQVPAPAPGGSASTGVAVAAVPAPFDPQQVQDQDDMTWDDYRPIPGRNWADRSLRPDRPFRIALIAIDFEDQPFVITQPKGSDPFGNPQIDPVAREDVPRFYADFFLEPSALNHGQTINGYWMEQSRGRFGITEVDAFGPYRMPEPLWAYGLNEYGQEHSTPDGSEAGSRMEPDVDSLWAAEHGDIEDRYDEILRIYAGYDETTVWQEFGEMKFNSPADIPPEWGNPNPDKPRAIPTRYVEWTSWLAGAQQWGLSSIRQGESSGTITHELGHSAFGIPDLNNNPYVEPYRRVAAGPWDMMDRGSFNGPGGPHMRWVVPPIGGGAMPAGLMLRNRIENEFIDTPDVLTLSREGLARTGLAVAQVTARAVEPLPGMYPGIIVRLDGAEPHDRTPVDDPAVDPLSPGTPNYNFYSLEVVQRIGYDSFTPDNGVLLAKNKDESRGRNGGPNSFNGFIWVIDANPQDMNMVDYVKPNGERVMRTVADFRQLNDALFHAGLDSGSEYEWTDAPNSLHFYAIDVQHDDAGIRSYTLAVRSLAGAGPHGRGVALDGPDAIAAAGPVTAVTFTLTNTGSAAPTDAALHPSDARTHIDADVYRLSTAVTGAGWSSKLPNALAAVDFGASQEVTVYLSQGSSAAQSAVLTLTAVSESDPTKTVTVTARAGR
ncbi:MAG: peptidase M6 [Gemmatimonadota bacterium]